MSGILKRLAFYSNPTLLSAVARAPTQSQALWHGHLGDWRSYSGISMDVGMKLEVTVEPLDSPNDGIFQLTLHRPQARNAIGRRFLHELR